MSHRTEFDAPDNQVYGAHSDKDKQFWVGLESILDKTPHSDFHLLNHWPVYTKRISLVRFIAHLKLFELITEMPGNIVELGVSRGVSFFTWHKLLEIFCPCDTSRKVIGFDSFEGLTDFSEHDGTDSAANDKRIGGWSAQNVEHEIFALNQLHNADNILARERSRLVKGRVQDTLKPTLESMPGMRIALLHFDLDLYEPTLFALEMLYDLVLPGGVIVFDEFALPPWGGEVSAWETFAKSRGIRYRVHKQPWTLTPNGYVIKDEE
jgi:hypothetical protein